MDTRSHSTQTISSITGTLLAGLAVTSHNSSLLSTVTADTVTVAASQPAGCPSGWGCADIGSPALAGSQSVSGATWTVQGAGSDIQGASDQFHFVWQSLAADCSVVARVNSESNTSSWAKAGVMLRGSTAAGSANYAVFITPGNGVDVQYRSATGGATSSFHVAGTPPLYLKVTRTGTSFTAYTSSNGTAWTLVPNSTRNLTALTGSLLGGMAVTSHNTSALCTATFDTVSA